MSESPPSTQRPTAVHDERSYVAALASLPGMTPPTLRRLLGQACPEECWMLVRRGRVPSLVAGELAGERLRRLVALAPRWAARAAVVDPDAQLRGWVARGVGVLLAGDPCFPDGLASDPSGPAVLFARGAPPAARGGRVAVVGTRSSTHYGEAVAAELGAGLTEVGTAVVTSLEHGIDASARSGALGQLRMEGSAGPITFVAGGVDVAYPERSAPIWDEIAAAGCILSEAAPGTRPDRWRFPRRNRLLAASSDVVVIVEAHANGGSMRTAEAALALGIPVCAVPGSVRSPTSRGTNALLADGAHLVRDVDDVLTVLELCCAGGLKRDFPRPRPARSLAGKDLASAELSEADKRVLACVEPTPTALEQVLRHTGLELGTVALCLEALVGHGLVRRVEGGYERCLGPDRLVASRAPWRSTKTVR